MIRHARVLQHVDSEGPGRIADRCRQRGIDISVTRLFAGDRVPESCDDDTLLVIMGGPMGVGDLADPRWPFLAHEVTLVQRCLSRRQPVLGVCLGSQLLAHAAGAAVYPNTDPLDPAMRVREVGFFPLTLHGDEREPCTRGLPRTCTMLHWHGDTFDLPRGADLLASTPACRHQWFRLGRHAIGLQFHPECDAATIQRWCTEDADFATLAHGPGTPQRIRAQIADHLADYTANGDRMLDNCLDLLCAGR